MRLHPLIAGKSVVSKRIPRRLLYAPLLSVSTVLLLVACAPNNQISTASAGAHTTSHKASPARPHATGGVSYQGATGGAATFRLAAGSYVIDQKAQYDPTNDPSGSGRCFFSGYLQGPTSADSGPLGETSPLVDEVPLDRSVPVTLGSGTYTLTIYQVNPMCGWFVGIAPNSGG
jgi:hypothetical protein